LGLDIFGNVTEEEHFDISRKKYKLFDFLGDLNQRKSNILRQDPEAERDYSPWIINLGMSMNVETIMYANEMNRCYGTTKTMQYDFYTHAVRSGRRYAKWAKDGKDKEVEALQEYYQINRHKATDLLLLLTEQQIEDIKMKLKKGGKK